MIPVTKVNVNSGFVENGIKIGKTLKQSKRFTEVIQFIKQYGALEQDENEIIQVFREFCPQLLDELEGLSKGLSLPETETLRLFAGYDMPVLKEMGCTSFMTKDYYVRNYDFWATDLRWFVHHTEIQRW